MNRTLLRKIAQNILDEPRHFNMGNWITPDKTTQRPTCGTACCIGGWAAVEQGWKIIAIPDGPYFNTRFVSPEGKKYGSVSELVNAAQKALQINDTEANSLFYTENWPDAFHYIAEDEDETPQAKAVNAADRIEHFIETGK